MNKFTTFLAGAAIGAAAMYFTTPRTGADSRQLASDKLGEVMSAFDTVDFGGQVPGYAQDFAAQAAATGSQLYNKAVSYAREAADAVTPTISDSDDELRQKIAAARERISAQVMQNANGIQDKVCDPIDIEAAVTEAAKADGAAAGEAAGVEAEAAEAAADVADCAADGTAEADAQAAKSAE